MASEDIALMAHLMRRAGFGASREELEARAARGYEATVEELLNPEADPVCCASTDIRTAVVRGATAPAIP